MKRNVSLAEISDGRLYKANDMVKADCGGCNGCSRCCHGMGNSIILDPYDVYRMTTGMGKSMQELLAASVELNVVDGVILPNLKMQGTKEACAYLDEEERCSIHPYRPGICRLFPLGRYWQDDTHFQYILQKDECHKHNLTKIKVKKWLDTPDLEAYNAFLVTWHAFLKEIQAAQQGLDEGQNRILTMYILKSFFALPYDGRDFYVQFEERMKKARQDLAMD